MFISNMHWFCREFTNKIEVPALKLNPEMYRNMPQICRIFFYLFSEIIAFTCVLTEATKGLQRLYWERNKWTKRWNKELRGM